MPAHRHLPYHPPRLPVSESVDRARTFQAELATRRSVRFFSDAPVPRELVERAILTAGSAPSGAHRQPWHFVAVSDPGTKRRIREAAEAEEREGYEGGRMPEEWLAALAPLGTDWRKPFLETAPWLVVAFAQAHGVDAAGQPVKHYYVQESVGIACGFFIAALHHMGLCTLTHTPSPMRFLTEILGRPARERPVMLFPVGYPAPDCTVPDLQRKSLEEISTWVETP